MRKFLWLFIALTVFIILRIPSLSEPRWYADEGVYASITFAMEQGKTLYTEIWDNKPPGIYLIYALGNPHNRIEVIKTLALISGLISITGLFALLRKLKIHKTAQFIAIASAVFLLGTPFLEGNIANAENFFLPLIIWGVYFGLHMSPLALLGAGVLFGLGFMIKFHPLFDLAALTLFLALQLFYNKKRSILELRYLFIGFLLPMAFIFLWFISQGNVPEAISTIFINNVSYTNLNVPPFYLSTGFKTLLLGYYTIGLFILYRTKKISTPLLLALILLGFELFAVLAGNRPFAHYAQQLVTGAIIAIALLAQYILSSARLYHKTIVVLLTVLTILIGSSVFYLGEGDMGTVSMREYYKAYENYKKNNEEFFWHGSDLVFEQLERDITLYGVNSTYIYTDNPWAYDATGTIPPIPYTTAYHQELIPNGRIVYLQELEQAQPELIVVDRKADINDLFFKYLVRNYKLDYEDKFFQFFVRTHPTEAQE